MEKKYELEKRGNVYLPTYSSLVSDICRVVENKEEKEGNYLSFRELAETFYHFSAGIDSEIRTILRSVLKEMGLSEDAYSIKVDKEKGTVCIVENFVYSDSRESRKLAYRELEGNIYLMEGPKNTESTLYALNYKLMTEEYENLKRLYNLSLCRDVYPSKYSFDCGNGWKVKLSQMVASIEVRDENTPKVDGECCFILRQSILNYIYNKSSPLTKKIVVICGDPNITQYVHQNSDVFLEGLRVDISSMPLYIRESLLRYQEFQMQQGGKGPKQKTLIERFQAWKSSLKG